MVQGPLNFPTMPQIRPLWTIDNCPLAQSCHLYVWSQFLVPGAEYTCHLVQLYTIPRCESGFVQNPSTINLGGSI